MILWLACFAIYPAATSASGLAGDLSLPEGGVHVANVAELPDGTAVVMVGRIEQPLGNTMFNFSDRTGAIAISVDYENQDQIDALDVNDIVEIYGTTAHDFDKFFVIVNQIVKR